ncbi:hypothetical protein JCM16303_005610 [Sporobolomyces ruberrimus]
MSLEATIIVLDNSVHSLNGDYAPTRLEAQSDAVHVLFNSKLRANPENEVGLMVMAGKGPEVLTTLTQDEGKLIAAIHEIKRGGQVDLQTGIQVAQLALKHRQNKNQRQRIIAFVGSPIQDSQASLVKLGKKLKKNNVALDIISFGTSSDSSSTPLDLSIPSLSAPTASTSTSTTEPSTLETNESKLEALIGAVSSSENSHFLSVDPGPHLLSEKIMQSPIVRGDSSGSDDEGGAGGSGGGGGGGDADEFGVDPNLDPELAMALRMSLQEEQARQAAAAASSGTTPSAATTPPGSSTSTAAGVESLETVPQGISTQITDPTGGASIPTNPNTGVKVENHEDDHDDSMLLTGEGDDQDIEDLDEDEELRRALLLSQGGEEGAEEDDVDMVGEDDGGDHQDDEDEDEDIARAIALSMQDAENQGKKE